jgi:hypothetical protein
VLELQRLQQGVAGLVYNFAVPRLFGGFISGITLPSGTRQSTLSRHVPVATADHARFRINDVEAISVTYIFPGQIIHQSGFDWIPTSIAITGHLIKANRPHFSLKAALPGGLVMILPPIRYHGLSFEWSDPAGAVRALRSGGRPDAGRENRPNRIGCGIEITPAAYIIHRHVRVPSKFRSAIGPRPSPGSWQTIA